MSVDKFRALKKSNPILAHALLLVPLIPTVIGVLSIFGVKEIDFPNFVYAEQLSGSIQKMEDRIDTVSRRHDGDMLILREGQLLIQQDIAADRLDRLKSEQLELTLKLSRVADLDSPLGQMYSSRAASLERNISEANRLLHRLEMMVADLIRERGETVTRESSLRSPSSYNVEDTQPEWVPDGHPLSKDPTLARHP